MNLNELKDKLLGAFGLTTTEDERTERKARKAYSLVNKYGDTENSVFLETLDYPVIRHEKAEYKGQIVDVQQIETTYQSAVFCNLLEHGASDTWSVSTSTERHTLYPDGFYTGSSVSSSSKDYATFEGTLKAMRAWELEQLAGYLRQKNEPGVKRLTQDELKALVGNTYFDQINGQQVEGLVHWSKSAREHGIRFEAAGPVAAQIFGEDKGASAVKSNKPSGPK